MHHVFVCTTEYADHWAKTIAKKQAQAAAMSEEERRRIREATPEEHADGQRGLHCGQTIGGKPVEEIMHRRAKAPADAGVGPPACAAAAS